MSNESSKPVIGFTCGDLNGIGIELLLKSLSESRLLDYCLPVVFANYKCLNFYRKSLSDINFPYQHAKDLSRLHHRQVNVVNCWEEDVQITPGLLNETGGKYALISLSSAVEAFKNGYIQGIVTAPIHKSNIQSPSFNYSGHTPYFQNAFNVPDVLMLMVAENLRVGLVTEHVPVQDIAKYITIENILSKLHICNESLQQDFQVEKPKIAVLSLNPHAGDEGLIGDEENKIIKPAIKEARHHMVAFGPYSSDAFFARGSYSKFDAVLAMYHDQGLIPFKSLAIGEGVNFTAGLPIVRTSPDHGTAFDIAGKGIADNSSFLYAIFECIDIIRRRAIYKISHSNPLKKMSTMLVENAQDESLKDEEDDR